MNTYTESTGQPIVHSFFDQNTNTVTHILVDPETKTAAIVDSVLDYEPNSGTISHDSANKLIAFVKEHKLDVKWILETHAHADHLSAAAYLKEQIGGSIAIGKEITKVQETFGALFDVPKAELEEAFDQLLEDKETLELGTLNIQVMHTPGHTPADVTYLVGDAAFVGDTLFMPDFGTARTDFPAGSAEQLYESIQHILTLPDETRLFMGHDYLPEGRNEYQWETTVKEEKANKHIKEASMDAFKTMRENRDAQLTAPRLILPSLQVNIRGGRLPQENKDGVQHLLIPINQLT
jgi:glyoxylase-like metal-dependent hydrolase (beta-lactamase superfamily II)